MSEERIGHYRIVAELGRGGMGIVYKAHEESLNRFVAIKVLGEHLAQDPDYVTRFVREAQSAAKLSHPNIVQIYFIGEDAGRHYFVMEYVSGRSLQHLLKNDGRMATARATRLVLQAASGLAAAHDQGVIHRDIKPANLILSDGNVLKIADFGLALMPDAASRLTVSGMFMGTPGYLSPEQCLDRDIDHRTDIYSLGVTFFEMLTGTMPFRADSPLALIRKITEVEPPSVADLNPDVDEPVRAILGRMMAKDRDQRYADAHQLAEALEDYLEATGARRETVAGARAVTPPPVPVADDGALNTSPTMAVDSGAGSAPAAPVATAAATGPAPGPPPPPPVPGSTGAAADQAGGAPWPDEEPPSSPVQEQAAVAAAPPPTQPRSGGSRVLMVVLVLVVLGVGLLGIGGLVAWRTGLLGRGVQMARAAFGGGKVAAAQAATEPMSADEVEVSSEEAPTAPEGGSEAPAVAGEGLSTAGATGSGGDVSQPGDQLGADQGEASQPAASSPRATAPDAAAAQPAVSGQRTSGRAHDARSSFQGGGEQAAPSTGGSSRSSRPQPAARAETAARPAAPARGTAVVVTGEPLLAGEVRSYLERRLGGAGVQLVDDGGLGGQSALAPGDVLARLRGDAATVVLAQVEYLGERQVRYMGRYDSVFDARITVQAYDVARGSRVGKPYSERVEYSHLNVGDKVERALVGESADLIRALR